MTQHGLQSQGMTPPHLIVDALPEAHSQQDISGDCRRIADRIDRLGIETKHSIGNDQPMHGLPDWSGR